MDPLEFDFMMGVDLLSDERRLMKGHVRKLQNLVPVAPGLLAKRKGTMGFGSSAFASFGSDARYVPQSMAVSENRKLPQFVVCGRINTVSPHSAAVHAFTPGALAAPLTYTWPTIPGRPPSIVNFGGKIYVFPGTGAGVAGAVISESGAAASIAAFAFNGAGNNYAPAVACVYRQRMAMADFGPGKENWLVLSDDWDPATIGASTLSALNGRALTVGVDGERITALVDIMLTAVGSPAQSALLILKEHSAYLMTGELNQTGDVAEGDAIINEMSVKAGCASWMTVAKTPHGVYWAGDEDVWLFRAGASPIPVGRKLTPALKETPPDFKYKWHGAYFGGFYRLAIGADGQGMDGASRCGQQYWLDLRDDPPTTWEEAKWFGPMIYKDANVLNTAAYDGTYVMVPESREDQPAALYGCTRMGSNDLALYTFDTQLGYDETGLRAYIEIDDQWDNEITAKVVTGALDFTAGTKDKVFTRVEMDMRGTLAEELILKAYVDGGVGGPTSLVAHDGATVKTGRNGYIVGADALDSNYLTREFEQLVAYPANGSRLLFKQLQLELTENQGYVVDGDNGQFSFTVGGTNYTATLTAGRYATLKTFCDEVVRAMGAISGSTFTHNVAAQNHGAVDIAISAGTWLPRFAADRSTRILGTQLGFDTAGAYLGAANHTASAQTRWRESPGLEIAGMMVKVRLIPRSPT